jgi:outer membrane autotransporter protein
VRADGTGEIAGTLFTPHASLAWQHAIGDVDPSATVAFASGGGPFTVLGTPLARDSVLVDAGLAVAIAPEGTLGVSYAGRFATGIVDNSLNGRFDWRF